MKVPVALEDQTAVDHGVESEIEVIQRLGRITEAGLLAPPFQQSVGAARQLIGDQTGDQVDGRHGFGLGLAQPGFQHGGHAAEAKLPQRALQFNQMHGWFPPWFCRR